MICPKCNKKPISGIRFFFKITPRNFLCQNCGTELKYGKMLKRGYYVIMSIALLLVFFRSWVSEWSENILGFQISFTTVFVIFMVLVLIAEYLAWSFGTLEEHEQKHL